MRYGVNAIQIFLGCGVVMLGMLFWVDTGSGSGARERMERPIAQLERFWYYEITEKGVEMVAQVAHGVHAASYSRLEGVSIEQKEASRMHAQRVQTPVAHYSDGVIRFDEGVRYAREDGRDFYVQNGVYEVEQKRFVGEGSFVYHDGRLSVQGEGLEFQERTIKTGRIKMNLMLEER